MKGTEEFEKVIETYLSKREETDKLFAERRKAIGRSIEDICKYILSEVKRSGREAFTDEEIYGLAVHAAEEQELGPMLQVGKSVSVVCPMDSTPQLTEAEAKAARQAAVKRLEEETYQRLAERRKKAKKTAAVSEELQPSIFAQP